MRFSRADKLDDEIGSRGDGCLMGENRVAEKRTRKGRNVARADAIIAT